MLSFVIGIIAGVLCTVSFLPQVIKIAKTKNTRDLSLVTFLMFAAGVVFWFIYGIIIQEIPIIIANAVTLALIMVIIVMKIRFK